MPGAQGEHHRPGPCPQGDHDSALLSPWSNAFWIQPSPSEITAALPVRDALLSQLKLSTNIEKREKHNTTKQETQPRVDIASKDSELLLKLSQEVFSPQ